MNAFDQYESEFTRKVSILRDKISQANNLSGEKKKAVISEAERQIEDAGQTLQYMEKCLKSVSREGARRMEIRLKDYTSDFARLKKDLQHAALVTSSYDRDFQNSTNQSGWNNGMDVRSQILVGTQTLDESSERLVNTHRIAVETETIGENVLGEMNTQKQTLERARDNLSTIDDNVTKGRRILSSMSRRIATNKLILAFIILILLAANGLVIYFKWVRTLV